MESALKSPAWSPLRKGGNFLLALCQGSEMKTKQHQDCLRSVKSQEVRMGIPVNNTRGKWPRASAQLLVVKATSKEIQEE